MVSYKDDMKYIFCKIPKNFTFSNKTFNDKVTDTNGNLISNIYFESDLDWGMHNNY